ncbi:MAG TPA: glutaredoxin family protein [Gammaproteobacteria bacterium]|nr:glutaredoxin family protein [Gammaproteobacteria bacterium]
MLLKLKLYSRSNCHLCEAMEDELRPYIEARDISVTRQLIDNDKNLEALYGTKVPVLTLDEKILCHYFLDTEILLKAIAEHHN